MTSNTRSTNNTGGLTALSTITGKQEYINSTNGILDVNASVSVDAGFNLQQVGGTNIALGQTTMSASLPVAVASDNNLAKETGGNLATLAGAVSASKVNVNISSGNITNFALETGGNLAAVNTNTAPLLVSSAGGYIRQDSNGTIAKESGGNLAAIVTDLTNGTQQTKITDATNIANVLAPGTANSTGNALLTSATTQTVTFSTTTAQAVASTDVGNYSYVSVNITSQGTNSTVTFQASNDNSNWYSANLADNTGFLLSSSTTITTKFYSGQIAGRYFRLNVTGISAGTTAGTVVFSTAPKGNLGVYAYQGSGAWNVGSSSATGSAVPANAFYIGVNNASGNLTGVAAASLLGDGQANNNVAGVHPTLYNGTTFDRLRSYGGVSAGTVTGIQGNAIVGGLMPIGTKLNTNSYHITTNTTNTPTASTAYVSSIAISAEVGGTTSSVTIQDKSGTPLKLVNGLATTAVSTVPTTINFQTPVLMTGGIDIITAGAVAGTVDVWINWFQ